MYELEQEVKSWYQACRIIEFACKNVFSDATAEKIKTFEVALAIQYLHGAMHYVLRNCPKAH